MEQILSALTVFILMGFGGYAVYTGIQLKRKGYLFENRIIYPGNCKKEDCKDEYGFVAFMIPRLFVCGGVSLLLGIFTGMVFFREELFPGEMGAFLDWIPGWFTLYVLPFLGIGIFIWYLLVQRKAAKRFW